MLHVWWAKPFTETLPQPIRTITTHQQWDKEENKMDGPTLYSDERAAEGASRPSASLDMAGVEALLADEYSNSSVDTLVKVPEDNNTAVAATTPLLPETTDEIDIVKVNKHTEVLERLFESPERPTRAEQDQDKQTQEQEQTQELFTNKDETEEKMEITQNNKCKPMTCVDLRTKFGQSPKTRRSPKHKRRKDKL